MGYAVLQRPTERDLVFQQCPLLLPSICQCPSRVRDLPSPFFLQKDPELPFNVILAPGAQIVSQTSGTHSLIPPFPSFIAV